MIAPTMHEIEKLSALGTVIPISKEIMADLLTPAAAYLRVAHGRRRLFLLESVEGGERIARYSFIGWDPFLVVRGSGQSLILEELGETWEEEGRPLDKLREISKRYRTVALDGMPPFIGGGVGYFAYDIVRQFERIPATTPDELGLDDFHIMYFSTVLAFDHLRHRIHIIVNILHDRGGQSLESKYQDAVHRIEQIEKRLTEPISLPRSAPHAPGSDPVSNLSPQEYRANVEKAKEYIRAGDIFQVVLSQRFSMTLRCDPFEVYRALRFINPSPYMFFLRMDDLFLVGASPEMLVRVSGRRVEYGPIAGTKPRGKTPEEDARIAKELIRDEKERAEHIMLVDLGRNDLGRVCEYGSVEVTDLMRIERYSHVMHIVSSVEGRLLSDLDCFHALEACLPAGTVSGAPKVRAMEIIEELEPSRRGVYGGAVGYVDFSGNLDTCIALRTLVIKDGIAYIQAGGGIVYDSDPEAERQESVNKASALIGAVRIAHQGLR
jgi:anthranilate synthase component 1